MRSTLASLILGAATLGAPAYAGGEGATVTVESGAAKRPCPSKDEVVNSARPLIQGDNAYVIARPGLAERPWCVGEAVPQDTCGEGAYDGMVCATQITENTVFYNGRRHKVAPGTVSNDLEGLCQEKQICIEESGLTLIPRPRPTRAPTPVDRTPRVAPNAAPTIDGISNRTVRDIDTNGLVFPITTNDDTTNYVVNVVSADGGDKIYSKTGLSGEVSHIINIPMSQLPSAGVYNFNAVVLDGEHTVEKPFTVTVTKNNGPTVNADGATIQQGQTISYTVSGADPERDDFTTNLNLAEGLTVLDQTPTNHGAGKWSWVYTIQAADDATVGESNVVVTGTDVHGAKSTLEKVIEVTAKPVAATVPPTPAEPTVPEYQNLQPNTLQGVFAWTGRDSRFAGVECTRDLMPKSKWQLRLGAGAGVLFGNDITPIPKAVNIMSEPYSQGHSGEELVHEIDNGNLVYHVWETAYQDALQTSWNTPASATWDVRVPALVGTPYFAKGTLNVAAGAMAEIVGPRTFDGTKTMQTYHDTPGHLELRAADGVTVLDENFGEMGTESGTFDPETSDISRKVPVQVYVLPRAEFNFKPLGEDSEHSPAITLGATYSLRTRTPSAYLSAGWKW